MARKPATRQATPEGRIEALRKIEERWTALIETLDGIPEDRIAEPGVSGDWSVTDLVAHITFWDGQAAINAELSALGQPERELDRQAMNEREAAASANRPYDDIRDELDETHRRTLFVLRHLPALDVKSVGKNTFDHYEEHRAEIQAWREQNRI